MSSSDAQSKPERSLKRMDPFSLGVSIPTAVLLVAKIRDAKTRKASRGCSSPCVAQTCRLLECEVYYKCSARQCYVRIDREVPQEPDRTQYGYSWTCEVGSIMKTKLESEHLYHGIPLLCVYLLSMATCVMVLILLIVCIFLISC